MRAQSNALFTLHILALMLCFGSVPSASAQDYPHSDGSPMTQERLESLLRSLAPGAEGVPGIVSFKFNGVQVECISDPVHNRMRLIAAVTSVSDLTSEHVAHILEANFHTALDARYATSSGYLYAAFIHPLGSLTEPELRSAVAQVSNLAQAFGTTYSSGELEYRGIGPPT